MSTIPKHEQGHIRWIDLAAADVEGAKRFYGGLFGWLPRDLNVGIGTMTRFAMGDGEVASAYQLSRRHLAAGVPSHWMPYVAVANAEAAAATAKRLGGRIIVQPFDSSDLARVALVEDPVGALIGLWQSK